MSFRSRRSERLERPRMLTPALFIAGRGRGRRWRAVAGCGAGSADVLEPGSERQTGHRSARRARPGCRRASTPGTRCSRVTSSATRSRPKYDRLLFFDVNGRPDAGARAHARGVAADARAPLRVGPVGAVVHRRLGPVLLREAARISSPIPLREGPVGLRGAVDRRLPPVPAPRLRRRRAARRGRGCAAARRAAAGRERTAAAGRCAALARDPHRLRRHRAAGRPPAGRRDPAGQPGAGRAARCSWASSPGSSRTRPARTIVTIPDGPVRAGNDDAGQLHAPAAEQLVSRSDRAASALRGCTRRRRRPRR